jgi:hypothetical protein
LADLLKDAGVRATVAAPTVKPSITFGSFWDANPKYLGR